MTSHRTLTTVADVLPGSEERLRKVLERLGNSIQSPTSPVGFGRCVTLHFARWILVGPPSDTTGMPTRLVFCASFDDITPDQRVREIVRVAEHALDEIYSLCEGYPPGPARTVEDRVAYLSRRAIDANAIFVGAPDRTLGQIHMESELRDHIGAFLDANNFKGQTARQVVAAVRGFVRGRPDLAWALEPPPPRRRTILYMALLLAGAYIALPVIFVWLLILRLRYERTERPDDLMPSDLNAGLLADLERIEDLSPQNQFSQLMVVKPSRFRRATLRLVLWATNYLSRNLFTEGEISRIPSIHFASWTLIDGDTRLLFQSNFDGSWDSYLGDFIDKAAFGLNAFLSNCVGFPRTRFLFLDGVTDVEHYKAWARNANIPTQAWYSAYPNLSVKNVNANSRIRLGLGRPMTESQAAAWLRNF